MCGGTASRASLLPLAFRSPRGAINCTRRLYVPRIQRWVIQSTVDIPPILWAGLISFSFSLLYKVSEEDGKKIERKNLQISISSPRTENIWTLTGSSCVKVLCSPTLASIYSAKARFCNSLSTNSLFQGPLDQDSIPVGLGSQIQTLQSFFKKI